MNIKIDKNLLYGNSLHNKTFYLANCIGKIPKEITKVISDTIPNNINNFNCHSSLFTIFSELCRRGAKVIGKGVLEIISEGYGFLRYQKISYSSSLNDIYISHSQIKKFNLRNGNIISGNVRMPREGERYFTLTGSIRINNYSIDDTNRKIFFEDLTPIYPQNKIMLELGHKHDNNISGRIIDIISPLGKGQRALIVAPPKTGKTVLMQNIARAIALNEPNIYIIFISIGERPEEVTDMIRSIKGEVVSSTFEESSYRHVQLAELVIEKARRMVECKNDVVILLDSITRLARAYNDISPSSGRILSGGVDSNALQRPKRFFGSARNIEEGGSLTIIATALIDTGSKMDEVIFEEFKGTGNAEIVLDRKISNKRLFPAIDINKSGTRKEELLIDQQNIEKSLILRKILNPMNSYEAVRILKNKLKSTNSNKEFFNQMNNSVANKKI